MTLCYLALGSNLQRPERQLRKAIQHIKGLAKTDFIQTASFYRSIAYGRKMQPLFYNTVIAINTYLSPLQLLKACNKIEQKQGRIRKIPCGARTLDIDILLYGRQKSQKKKLRIPHPSMLLRDWVMVPLLEIAPDCCMPNGEFLKTLNLYTQSSVTIL